MSLKIEQRLLNHQFTEFEPKIYATGVYLVPLKVNLNGVEKWVWVADEFIDDTYFDGKNVTTRVFSDTIPNLIAEDE